MRTPTLLLILAFLVAACGGAPAASAPATSAGGVSQPPSTMAEPSTEPTEEPTEEPTPEPTPAPAALSVAAAVPAVKAALTPDWPGLTEGWPSGMVGFCDLTIDMKNEPDWTETRKIATVLSDRRPLSAGSPSGERVGVNVRMYEVYPDDVMTQLEAGFDTCGPFDLGPTSGVGTYAASAATIADVEGPSWSSSFDQDQPNAPRCTEDPFGQRQNCHFEQRGFYAMVRGLLIDIYVDESSAAASAPEDPDAILADVVEKVIAALEDA